MPGRLSSGVDGNLLADDVGVSADVLLEFIGTIDAALALVGAVVPVSSSRAAPRAGSRASALLTVVITVTTSLALVLS
jgi:hypothetical protein